MLRRWTWGDMVRARLGADTLVTIDQLALRRRVVAAVILGLALGAGLQCAWPDFVPGAAAIVLSALRWLAVLLAIVALLIVLALIGILTAPRHG